MKCTYCDETVSAPGGARNHQKCERDAKAFAAWVSEEPVDAVDAITAEIAARITRGDSRAMAWLRLAVSNYETKNLHLAAPEIADTAVTAGLEPHSIVAYETWQDAERRARFEADQERRTMNRQYVNDAVRSLPR